MSSFTIIKSRTRDSHLGLKNKIFVFAFLTFERELLYEFGINSFFRLLLISLKTFRSNKEFFDERLNLIICKFRPKMQNIFYLYIDTKKLVLKI